MPLSTAERLEGELTLTAPDFGLDEGGYEARIEIWEELAGEREGVSTAQRAAHIRYLALRAAIMSLIQQADKFRAEGDITTEKNILGRVSVLKDFMTAAEVEAGLVAPVQSSTSGRANPAPEFEEWGIR